MPFACHWDYYLDFVRPSGIRYFFYSNKAAMPLIRFNRCFLEHDCIIDFLYAPPERISRGNMYQQKFLDNRAWKRGYP
jgi:hypothetical protein